MCTSADKIKLDVWNTTYIYLHLTVGYLNFLQLTGLEAVHLVVAFCRWYVHVHVPIPQMIYECSNGIVTLVTYMPILTNDHRVHVMLNKK